MGQRYEFYLKSRFSGEIYCQLWRTSFPASLGTVLITHGLAEHSENYHKFSTVLNSWGLDTLAWDLVGHGQSSGKRGFIKDFDHFLADQRMVIEWSLKNMGSGFYEKKEKNGKKEQNEEEEEQNEKEERNGGGDKKGKKPLVLFSHSLGGLITIKNLLIHRHLGVDALFLSSPCLGFSLKIPRFKIWFAKWLSRFLPRLTVYNEISYEALTRNKEMIKSYLSDPLRHEKISVSLFLGMVASMEFVKDKAQAFHWPVLFQVSGKDKIVDTKEALICYHKMNSSFKKFIRYPESYHEIYNDFDRGEAFKDLRDFLSRFFELKK